MVAVHRSSVMGLSQIDTGLIEAQLQEKEIPDVHVIALKGQNHLHWNEHILG